MRSLSTRAAALTALVSVLGMTACGSGDNESPAAVADTGSTVAPSADAATESASGAEREYETTWVVAEPVIDASAVAKFGQADAEEGTAVIVDLTEDVAFDQELTLAQRPERLEEVLALADQMTPSAADDWTTAVNDVAHGDQETYDNAASHVFALAFYSPFEGAMMDGKLLDANRDGGPVAVSPRITSTKTSVTSDGRLQVKVKSSADMRVTVGGKPRVAKGTERDMTFWLDRTDRGWKIDGFTGNYSFGTMRPEK